MRTFSPSPRYTAFTLVEIMIVVAIIGIIIAISVPAFIRAREMSRARACQENLAKIEGAVDQYALEFKLTGGDTVTLATDLIDANGTGYLKATPRCPAGGTYSATFTVDTPPACSLGANASATYAPHIIHPN